MDKDKTETPAAIGDDDIIQGDDGFWVFWPTVNKGAYSANDLRNIAGFLDDNNKAWLGQLEQEIGSEHLAEELVNASCREEVLKAEIDGLRTAHAAQASELSDLQILLVSARQRAERAEAQLAEANKALAKIERRTAPHPDDEPSDDTRDKRLAHAIARRALEVQGRENG